VLEETSASSIIKPGLLETISVHLRRTKETGKFIIVPSGKELEKRLMDQVKISWEAAIEKSKKYLRKKTDRLEVVIRFDKRLGYYTGDSLGTALAILFLEEILKFYNSPVIINKNSVVAITGGMDKDANILPVSEEIIKEKIEVVFYSGINLFVVPKPDEAAANEKLEDIKSQYPNRKLKLISVEDFDDVLNRRDIVEIRKQKIILRSAKFALKNWAAVLFLAMVIFLVYVGRFYDFNTNPAILVNKGYWLSVQNKNGKELWSKEMNFNADKLLYGSYKKISQLIYDVDGDGNSEVLLANEFFDADNFELNHGISCYDSDMNRLWHYKFEKVVSTPSGSHNSQYLSYLIDIVKEGDEVILYSFAVNAPLYPSVIYKLNARTGEKLEGELWHYGHLAAGLIGDFDSNSEKELVMVGINNAFERCVLFSIDLKNLSGQSPYLSDNKFLEIGKANFNEYILLPKTDYSDYFRLRFNWVVRGDFGVERETKRFNFYTIEGEKFEDLIAIGYYFNFELDEYTIYIGDAAQVKRDSLVARGEISGPYTTSPEFIQMLEDQIRYWDGKKFISFEDWKNKSRP